VGEKAGPGLRRGRRCRSVLGEGRRQPEDPPHANRQEQLSGLGTARDRVQPGSTERRRPLSDLRAMDDETTGGGLRRLTRASHFSIEWSADGRKLLTSTYRSSSGMGNVVDVETARVHPVLRGRHVIPLALSHDGRSVLAWVPSTLPHGNLVRVGLEKTRTILMKDADQLADWNA
jgi:hypothetical protein